MKKTKKTKDTTKITLWEITYRTDIENVIRELNPSEYAYILHDKDKDINGEPKKPHYHIWCRFESPVRNTMITRVLNLSNEYNVKTARNQRACIMYLTHETKEARKLGKYIYDRADVITNIDPDDLARIYASETSTKDEITAIMNLLGDYSKYNANIREYNASIDNRANQEICELIDMPILNKTENTFEMFIYEIITNGLMETYNKYYNSVFRRMIKKVFGE